MDKYTLKTIYPDEFNYDAGTNTTSLIDQVNSKFFIPKTASDTSSEIEVFVKSLKPDPNNSYVHLISLGSMEWYGPNKRGDGFNESSYSYRPPAPYGPEAVEIELDGGLTKYHNPTFKANGKVYREHHSIVADKSAKPLGDVVLAVYNEPMHRGELVIRLDNKEWEDDIQRISQNKPVYFSMGCLCPNDVCSWCGKRISPKDDKNRCIHLKKEVLSFKKDGTQVVAITDTPIFYDISRVARPADKIAFSLAKVASEGNINVPIVKPMPATLLDKLNNRDKVDRIELLIKLAAEEKVISKELKIPVNLPDQEDNDILNSIQENEIPKVLCIMKKHRTMLPFPHFIKMMGGTDIDDVMPLVGEALPGIFNRVINEQEGIEEFIEDSSYEGEEAVDNELLEKIIPLISKYSLNDEPIRRRVTRVIIIPSSKVASDRIFTPSTNTLAFKLAKEYARYQMSFLTRNKSSEDIRLTLAQNHSDIGYATM